MIDRYDHIVNKYENDGFNDFMFRRAANTLQEHAQLANINVSISESKNAPVVIIAVALISITSIGVLLVVKRRKGAR